MATKITNGNHQDSLSGSAEKRLDVAPDGTLWAALVIAGTPGRLKHFRSIDGGTTWIYASGSDLMLGQNTAVPSFFIDADGFAHVSWVTWANDPQLVMYARGTPLGGRGWSWKTQRISPAQGRLGVDSDLVAFRAGSGWVAFVSWNTESGGHTSRLRISASGSISVEQTIFGPASGSSGYQLGSMEFAHIGDGKTPSASPSVFYTNFRQGSTDAVRINRARYSGGSWTWETPVVAAASIDIARSALVTCYDGAVLMGAFVPRNAATISVFEWSPGSASVTYRNPPAPPAGTGVIPAISMSIDPLTDDVYLAFYDLSDGDMRWARFTRSSGTWGPWQTAVSASPPSNSEDGKISLVRHPPRDSIDMLYATGGRSSWSIHSMQLQALVRAPIAPTLIEPASGALADLERGGRFAWRYNPVSPGDSQQGWSLRRKNQANVVDYWNDATQAWSSASVLNPGNVESMNFPAGAWPSGQTFVWSVRTRSSTGSDSPWATDRTVVTTAAPIVNVTGPYGLVYGESTPLVTWDYTSPTSQRSFEVAIFAEATTYLEGFDPATTAPVWRTWSSSAIARSARIGTALEDGVGYVAFVRATSSQGVSSAWDSSAFGISISPPEGPVVELREQINHATGCPRIRLDILAASNYLTLDQSVGLDRWESDENASIFPQLDDSEAQLLRSLKVTSMGPGLVSVRTAPGQPPAAPYGQPQPLGPLDFPVVPGAPYTALASIKGVGEARAARIVIRWYDADDGSGVLIGETIGEQVLVGSDVGAPTVEDIGWGEAWGEAWGGGEDVEIIPPTGSSYVPAVASDLAPPRAKRARVAVQVLGATAIDETFYVTRVSLAPGRSAAWALGGYAATQTVRIERSLDGGLTWSLAAERVKTDLYQRAVIFDRLMPYGRDVQYRAMTVVDAGVSTLTSGASLTSTIRVDADMWAFRDPSDDTGEMAVIVTDMKESDDEAHSVHRPAGRLNPIVDTEGGRAGTGSITFFAAYGSIEEAKRVVRRVVPMVVQSPAGRVMTVRFIQRDYSVWNLRHREIELRYIEIGAI